MKINKTLCKITISLMVILICCSTICYASGLPDITLFEPEPSLGTTSESIIETILGALRIVGIIGIVIAIALIGFNTIMGSASEKAEWKGKYTGIIIASALLTGGTWIAEMIISVAESL